MNKHENNSASERDASSLRILGTFFFALGLLVLLGTFWTLDNQRALVVNLISGLVLIAVGVGMLILSQRISRRSSAPDESG